MGQDTSTKEEKITLKIYDQETKSEFYASKKKNENFINLIKICYLKNSFLGGDIENINCFLKIEKNKILINPSNDTPFNLKLEDEDRIIFIKS